MLEVQVFDFDDPESWANVQAVVNEPLAARALAAGMNARCRDLEEEWTPELGPWQLADRQNPNWPAMERFSPKSNSPDWYRIFGYCNAIAPWCAAIGSLVYPDHQWLVWYNRHVRKFRCHAAGMGLRDAKNKQRSIVIMDILWGRQVLRERTERKLLKTLVAPKSFSLSIEEAIEQLESGQCQ